MSEQQDWRDANLNDLVRVKLTDEGRALLRKRWEEQAERFPDALPYVPPKEDADGWSEWMLWDLIRRFGGRGGIHMGGPKLMDNAIQLRGTL